MRHGKKVNHLGRTSSHRKAMMSNMAASLILHKRINTTLAKAKALRVYVEPLITKSKDDSTHNRRTVFAYLKNKEAVSELFRSVSPKVAERPGGYTRIIKLAPRLGDNAEMALIELVDFNDLLLAAKAESTAAKSKTTRRSRRKAGASATPSAKVVEPVAAAVAPVVEETKAEEQAPASEENLSENKAEGTEGEKTE